MIQLSRSARLELQPAGYGAEIGETRGDVLERRAGRARPRRGAERVRDVVRAAGLQQDGALAERTLEREARRELAALDRLHDLRRREVRTRARTPKVTTRRARRDAAPVVRRRHRRH